MPPCNTSVLKLFRTRTGAKNAYKRAREKVLFLVLNALSFKKRFRKSLQKTCQWPKPLSLSEPRTPFIDNRRTWIERFLAGADLRTTIRRHSTKIHRGSQVTSSPGESAVARTHTVNEYAAHWPRRALPLHHRILACPLTREIASEWN